MQDLLAEIQLCYTHSCPRLSNESANAIDANDNDNDDDGDADDNDNDNADAEAADDLAKYDGYGHKDFLCMHEECSGKLKTRFKTWKNLLRHYTIRISLLSAIHGEKTDASNSQMFNVTNFVDSVTSP